MDWGWKRSFRLKREGKAVLGLDIGLSSIKIVRLRKESDGYVVTACGISLPNIPVNLPLWFQSAAETRF